MAELEIDDALALQVVAMSGALTHELGRADIGEQVLVEPAQCVIADRDRLEGR